MHKDTKTKGIRDWEDFTGQAKSLIYSTENLRNECLRRLVQQLQTTHKANKKQRYRTRRDTRDPEAIFNPENKVN